MLEIKHIPFLYVPNPPCRYELQRITDKLRGHTFECWEVEAVEQKLLKRARPSVVYVELASLGYRHDGELGRVFGAYPALQHSKEDLDNRFPGSKQFNFGQYYDPEELFLMDDIIEWSRHHCSWLEIRTVNDLIK